MQPRLDLLAVKFRAAMATEDAALVSLTRAMQRPSRNARQFRRLLREIVREELGAQSYAPERDTRAEGVTHG
jgi:hypothetical protein